MTPELIDRFRRATDRPRSSVEPEDMEWFGINNLRRAAKTYNLLRDGRTSLYRRRLYRKQFPDLIAEHDAPATDTVMRDGWAIDTSCANPHLDRVLAEAEHLIAERGMTKQGMDKRAFIRDLMRPEDLPIYPSFLDFALSSDVLSTVAAYMDQIPVLSTTVPPGVRLTESSIDGQVDDTYKSSQLYHLDIHDTRAVYVILLVRDATPDSGPFTFLSASTSAKVAHELGYRKRHARYQLSDEAVYSVVNEREARPFTYPKGSILYIDSNRCMHYGSRDAHTTRYQLMCSYMTPCRTDFTERRRKPHAYPSAPSDSQLRRLLLDKRHRVA
ncbi:MAG: hypothetical protein ACR2NA_04315 [Solirubrobacterales bacterium]